MATGFPYLEITKRLHSIVGTPAEGTRIYEREGTYEESGRWFEELAAAFPDDNFVSPGGVAMFAEVSRAAVHKRLNEGKLTAFAFYVTKVERTIFGHRKKLRQSPYMYIPVSECKAWAKELEQRPERQEKK